MLLLLQFIMDVKFLPPEGEVKSATMVSAAMPTSLCSSDRLSASKALASSSPKCSVTSGSRSQMAGQKRKRSRWSSGPSADEVAIAEAMASFSNSPSTSVSLSQQQLTAEQQMQLKEQIEV